VRLPTFLPPSVLASVVVHGAAVAFACLGAGPSEGPAPRERPMPSAWFWAPSEPAGDGTPGDETEDVPFELAAVRAALPPDEPPPVEEPREPREPASSHAPGDVPAVRLGIAAPPAGALARRPGTPSPEAADAAPHVPAATPAARPQGLAPGPATPPRPSLANRAPSYPLEARRLGWQGLALLRVVVRADGSVGEVALEQSTGHEALDRAAVEAVRAWSFAPARRDGAATEATVRLPVVFRLS
jgi:protein TonB